MDQFTLEHLDRWLEKQFSGDQHPNLRDAMIATYESRPEYFGRAGWWSVYDQSLEDWDDLHEAA